MGKKKARSSTNGKATAARRKAKRPRQKRIAGTYDPLPPELAEQVSHYVDTLRARQQLQEEENTLRAKIIESFRKHGLESVPIDDDETKHLVLVHIDEDKLKIKKRKEEAVQV